MSFIRNRWYIAAWDGEVASKPLAIAAVPVQVQTRAPSKCPYLLFYVTVKF